MRNCRLGQEVACWFQWWKLNKFCLTGLKTLVLLVLWMGLFLWKSHPSRCWGWLCLLNWIGALTWSLLSKLSKEIGALICSMKFLSPEAALYLYKSTIQSSMEYCYHVWAGTLCCYFELLDKLQKWIYRAVGPSLAAFLNLWLIIKM